MAKVESAELGNNEEITKVREEHEEESAGQVETKDDEEISISKVESCKLGNNDVNSKVREDYEEEPESKVKSKDDKELSNTIVTGTQKDEFIHKLTH